MGKKRDITVEIHGIRYEEFAGLKWRQFLQWSSLAVAVLALAALIAALRGGLPDLPASSAMLVILAAAVVAAVYRNGIRKLFQQSGLSDMELKYVFDRDGWTVRRGDAQARVLWSRTWRVRRDRRALMLYPNRKSVNLVPLRDMTAEELEQVLRWVQGK